MVFFLIVISLYWLMNSSYRRQNWLLFVASYVFYAWWDIRFLFLIVVSTVVDYWTSLLMQNGRLSVRQKTRSGLFLVFSAFAFATVQWRQVSWQNINIASLLPDSLGGWWVMGAAVCLFLAMNMIELIPRRVRFARPERFFLFWCVFTNLAILGVFKYFNFFTDSFVSLWSMLFNADPGQITTRIILPVGISFFTFQTMSHAIDVYRKDIPATGSLLELGTYVAFFPQLVAGPIERGAHLLPQFQRPRKVTREQFREGTWLIFWGLYKKIVVADNVAKIVNGVFGPYDSLSLSGIPEDGLRCLIAIYAFAVQIYCDFSGYSDIARGTAKLLGFDIMLNFNLPYFAKNPPDFWRRWHISLSTWLRDYLYIPLGGNRYGKWNTYRNLIITMLLGGLWHGAAWTFVLWGAFHGLLLAVWRLLSGKGSKTKPIAVRVFWSLVTFHLICFGWLLFRAQNIATITTFTQAIFTNLHASEETFICIRQLLFYSWFLILFQVVQGWTKNLNIMSRVHWFVRLNVWVLIFVSLFRLARPGAQEFIYFAF